MQIDPIRAASGRIHAFAQKRMNERKNYEQKRHIQTQRKRIKKKKRKETNNNWKCVKFIPNVIILIIVIIYYIYLYIIILVIGLLFRDERKWAKDLRFNFRPRKFLWPSAPSFLLSSIY